MTRNSNIQERHARTPSRSAAILVKRIGTTMKSAMNTGMKMSTWKQPFPLESRNLTPSPPRHQPERGAN